MLRLRAMVSPRKLAVLATAAALGCLSMSGSSAQTPSTWDRTIGSMCIQGVPATARTVTNTGSDNGVAVQDFNIAYSAGAAGKKPLVRVFRAPPKAPQPLATCAELVGDVILEGEVKELKVTGGRETAPGSVPAIVRIDPDKLYVEITKAKSTLSPLYGGTLQLGADGAIASSGRAWIRNPDRLVAVTGQPLQGSIDVESWGRKLAGVKVVLPGTVSVASVDMTAGNTNVVVRVPLAGGPTELRRGTFTAVKTPFAGATVALPGADFGTFKGQAANVQLTAGDDGVTFKVNDLAYAAANARFSAPHSEVATGGVKGLIKAITSTAPRSGETLSLSDTRLSDLSADGQGCGYRFDQASVAAADLCAVTIVDAGAAGRRWRFETAKPSQLVAAPALSSAGQVVLTSVVAGDKEQFSGRIADAVLRTGAFEFERNALLLTSATSAAGRVSIPFAFEAPPGSGAWNVRLSTGELALTGKLEELRGKGVISVGITDPSSWAVDVAKDDLAFKGKVTATYQPYLYGAKPAFGALSLSLNADSALHADAKGATGVVGAGVGLMTVADMMVELGEAEGDMVLAGLVTFDGAVALDYDLGTGVAAIDTGRLLVQNVKLLTKPNKPGDLGDIRLWQGAVALAQLKAEFKDGKGGFEATGLSITASRLESKPRAADDGPGNQLVWSGALNEPATVARIAGNIARAKDSTAMKVADAGINDLKVALKDIRMGQGKALKFQGGSLALALKDLNETHIEGTLALRDTRIAADTVNEKGQLRGDIQIASLDIKITGGTPGAPNGTGVLAVSALDLTTDSILEIKESCDSKPDFQGVPIRARVQTGPMLVNFTLEGGGIKGKGAALATAATVADRGEYECRASLLTWTVIKEQRAIYDYPCPTWSKPFRMCRGWTIIVPELKVGFDRLIRVRHFYAGGVFTVVSLNIEGTDKIKSCGKLGVVAPLADVSYFITPRTGIGIADSILQEVLDATSRPFASQVVSGLGVTLGAILPQTADGFCT